MMRLRALTLCTASVLALGLAVPVADAQQAKPGQQNESTTVEKSGQFTKKAAMTNMFEIEAAKIALEKSRNSQIRSFAQKMIDDHQTMSKDLKAAAGGEQASAMQSQMDREHTQKLQQLRQASGGEFDRLYIGMQVAGHRQALDLHQDYARSGTDPKLKQAATKSVPHIQQHLQQAQQIQRQTAQAPREAPSDRSPSGRPANPAQPRAGERQ